MYDLQQSLPTCIAEYLSGASTKFCLNTLVLPPSSTCRWSRITATSLPEERLPNWKDTGFFSIRAKYFLVHDMMMIGLSNCFGLTFELQKYGRRDFLIKHRCESHSWVVSATITLYQSISTKMETGTEELGFHRRILSVIRSVKIWIIRIETFSLITDCI